MTYNEFIKPLFGNWYDCLLPVINSNGFKQLLLHLNTLYNRNDITIYPQKKDVFNAFKLTDYDNLKIVILAQDPYPNNRANGLAFSNNINSEGLSPSLRKIKERIEYDYPCNKELQKDLMHLPKQGIFMSNATMTVEANKPGSHLKLWENFTREFLNRLSFNKDKLIFCLWGRQAQMYEKYVNINKHIILRSEHPSYAARQHRLWDFNFKELNKIVYDNFKTEISWL